MKIYAYIDRSGAAKSVCQHAVWAARQLNVPVEIIHVLDQVASIATRDYSGYLAFDAPETAMEERFRLDEMQNRVLIEEGRRLLDGAADSMREAGFADVSQRLFQGTLLEHVKQHAGDALLIVLGKQGEGVHQDGHHLGRNIERVVRAVHTPVLICAPAFTEIDRAILAWDGGKSAGEAVHLLSQRPLPAVELSLLHIADNPDRVPPGINDARDHLQGAGMSVDVDVRTGDSADVILAAVSELQAQLLILGAYGHSRIRQLMVGSTTTELLMRSSTSVLVFH
jgi:nucleotide-binding universal stress UspA family protein